MVGRKGDKSGKKAEEPDVIASRASRTKPSFLFNEELIAITLFSSITAQEAHVHVLTTTFS